MSLNLGTLSVRLVGDANGLLKTFSSTVKAAEKMAADVKKASNEVAKAMGALTAVSAVALKLASTVDGPTKQAMDGLEQSTKLLAVQVADMLLPAVKSITDMFRQAAAVVAGLDPETKKNIASFAVLAAQLAIAAKALSTAASLAGGFLTAMKAMGAVLTGIGAGPLLAIGVGLAVVAAGIAALHYAWRTNLGGIATAWKKFADWFSDTGSTLFAGVSKYASMFVDGFLSNLRDLAGAAAKLFEMMGQGDAAKVAIGVYQGIESTRKKILDQGFFKAVVTRALDMGKAAGGAFVDEWKRIMDETGIADMLGGLKKGTPIGLGRGMPGKAMPTMAAAPGSASFEASIEATSQLVKMATSLGDADDAVRHFADQLSNQAGKEVLQGLQTSWMGVGKGRFGMNTATAAGIGGGGAVGAAQGRQAGAERAREAAAAGAARLAGIANLIGNAGQQLLGAVGDLVSSIVQGAQQGGVWGAIIAAFMEVAKKTASAMQFVGTAMNFVKKLAEMVEPLVKPIFDALTNVLGIVADIVQPVFAALQPLFESIGRFVKNLAPILYAVGDVLSALSPVIKFVGEMVGRLLDSLKPILDIIGGVIKAIASVLLGFMLGLNIIAATAGDEAAKAEVVRIQKAMSDLWDPNSNVMAAADAAGDKIRNMGDSADQANAVFQKVADSLTNVPTGYKIALARLNADNGMSGRDVTGHAFYNGRKGDLTIIINGDVTNTDASNWQDLANEIKRNAQRTSGQQAGSITGNTR